MNDEKLNKWAELLLDTGKRNNLVNFKDTKLTTAEIISPNFENVFKLIEHSTSLEVFDAKLERDDDILLDDSEENQSKEDKEAILKKHSSKLKRNQVLVYNIDGKPNAALKSISKKALSAIEETGVNIAYLAFGFVNWKESEASEFIMRAPILLVPISIEQDSSVNPYTINIIDGEFIVNPTFSFKLKSEYGIDMPEFDEDNGITAYFNELNEIFSKLNWTISFECKIGLFSFLKINMYTDIKENADKIKNNPAVKALAGEYDDAAALGGVGAAPYLDLLDLHNVVDADSSQLEAIEMAREGKSFVLQGPPGTGKSQTITNIIAECLNEGRKVLFVSEKLAALSVVYDKLKKAGLEEFCLELHSHKANKNQVIEELCNTIKLPKNAVSDKAKKELSEKKEIQSRLDGYAKELHAVRPSIDKTLYQLFEDLSSCRNAKDIEFAIDNIKTKGHEYIKNVLSLLDRYLEYSDSVGYDYHNNIWYGYSGQDSSYQAKLGLKNELIGTVELCKNLKSINEKLEGELSLSCNNICFSYIIKDLFFFLKDSQFITGQLLKKSNLAFFDENINRMSNLASSVLEHKKFIDAMFDKDFYKLDASNLFKKLTRQFTGFFSRIFSGEYKGIIKEIRLCKLDGKKVKYDVAVQYVKSLLEYQTMLEELYTIEKSIKPLLNESYQGVNTNFDEVLSEIKTLQPILNYGIDLNGLIEKTSNDFDSYKEVFADYCSSYEHEFAKNNGLDISLSNKFEQTEYPILIIKMDEVVEKCNGCLNDIDNLDNWCEFRKLLNSLDSYQAKAAVDIMIKNNIEVKEFPLTFKKIFVRQWIDAIMQETPLLKELSRISHDELINQFKRKEDINFEINKATIRSKLSMGRPSLDMVAQGSAISVLLREGEKKRKKKGIRQLLSEIGELVQILKPCFLMSPLSVSTYLCPNMVFDTVVFDEASQIFPQDAIGAIYRGKQLIVVGDSKQMPPSNFFNSVADVDDDEDDINDFESILDLCTASYPQRRLKWHYRSRCEELISFSNKNFYGNDLITFPSSKKSKTGVGVDYYYVDGVFDRKSKTNIKEAEKVVDLVFENFEKYPERSVGVVAFSISQQNLIDKLIYKRRREDPSKEAFFKMDIAEPFFVKNLETVQGDERDTIIFSIAYARDSLGKLLMNFGPLNREGGERRLNVAVTRAKHNVKLVTSMHYTDIDLSRTESKGARLLREYLDYAENGGIALQRSITVNPFEHFDSEFEMEVCEFLRENGVSVDTQVGCSSFKIDLAVKHPNTSDYILAVECDGASYHSSKTARDRDRLRQEILERMGWSFYRIWSTDWFRNKEIEKKKLLQAIGKAYKSTPKPIEETKSEEINFTENVIEKPFKLPVYLEANIDMLARKHSNDFLMMVRQILEIEAPLSEEWLLKRIAYLFGREKVTSFVKEEYNRFMLRRASYGIERKNGFLYVKGKEIPMLRIPEPNSIPRDVKYISTEELALGMKEVLKQNVSAEKTGLFRLLVQQLGFSRFGDNILARLEKALELIKNEINISDDIISLK